MILGFGKMGHVFVIRGKVHVSLVKGRYLSCKIYVRSQDVEKIKHLDKKEVTLLVISE